MTTKITITNGTGPGDGNRPVRVSVVAVTRETGSPVRTDVPPTSVTDLQPGESCEKWIHGSASVVVDELE